jgi:outer membrane protein OmpA-like peptidoglycan-associated protein
VTQGTIVGTGLSAFVLLCYVTINSQLHPILEALADGSEVTAAAERPAPDGATTEAPARDAPELVREPSLSMSAAVGAASGAGRKTNGEATQAEIDRILAERGVEWDDTGGRPTHAGARTLDRLVSLLAVEPDARVQVIGHRDARDADPSAAQRRSEAVRRYFVESGIAADRVRADVADPTAAADGRKGRSIEVRLEEGK